MAEVRTHLEPKCLIRPGDACSLCVQGASGPQDCGLVYLLMSDPDLRERLYDSALPRPGLSVDPYDPLRLTWKVDAPQERLNTGES
jgi:hypothetical protein